MVFYTFGTVPVYDPIADKVLENATGGIFVDAKNGATIPIFDLNFTPITTITSNANGMSTPFCAQDQLTGLVKFGDLVVTVWANEVGELALEAKDSKEAAEAAATAAQAALTQVQSFIASGGGSGGGVTNHGALTGLTNDDHPQYFNQARGDLRYYTQAQVMSAINSVGTTTSAADRLRSNHVGTQVQSTIEGLVSALLARPQVVIVTTGTEARPTGSTTVIWDARTGVHPVNATTQDLVLTGSDPDPPAPSSFTGNIALWGDSLTEGLHYTPTFAQTIGALLQTKGRAPCRYWISPTVAEDTPYAVSTKNWEDVEAAFNGCPYSFYLEPGQNVQWPLTGNPAQVRVYFRRGNGEDWNWSTAKATALGAGGATATTTATEPTDWANLEYLTIANPGAWVRLTCATARFEVCGVQVFPTLAAGGSGLYSFAVSGMDSQDLVNNVINWWTSAYASLSQHLEITATVSAIMSNDVFNSYTPTEFGEHIVEARNNIAGTLGHDTFVGVLMPNVAGDNLSGYNTQSIAHCTRTIDARSMPLNATNVGADGAHWKPAGNQAFADLVAPGLL